MTSPQRLSAASQGAITLGGPESGVDLRRLALANLHERKIPQINSVKAVSATPP